MKNTRSLILAFMLFGSMLLSAQQDSAKKKEALTWHTDIVKAAEISKASNKPLFALFTGSDWCVWCKKLQSDVLSKPEFIRWANKNVVLVEVDFPRGKPLSPELAQQNASLQQTFQVQGYPTVHLFFLNKSSDGARYDVVSLGTLGYPQEAEKGKEEVKFISNGNQLLQKSAGK